MIKKSLYGKEVFYLTLYGMNLFLEVSDILGDRYIRVRELESYDHYGRDMIKLTESGTHFKPKEEEQWLLKKHEFRYIVDDGKFKIPVDVEFGSKIYVEAQLSWPGTVAPGTYFAEMVGDGSNDSFKRLAHTAFLHRIAVQEEEHTPWA